MGKECLKEISYVMHEFGCLRIEQLIKLIQIRRYSSQPLRLLKQLAVHKRLFLIDDYACNIPEIRRNDNVISAYDIFLNFMDEIEPGDYCSTSNYPFSIYFMKNKDGEKQEYFIGIIEPGNEFKMQVAKNSELFDEHNHYPTYIIGLYDKNSKPKIPKMKGKMVYAYIQWKRP